MTLHEHAAQPLDSARSSASGVAQAPLFAPGRGGARSGASGAPLAFMRKALTIAELEVRKLRHDPTDIFMRTVQPALWLLVFGETFSHIRAIPTGHVSYLQFMAPGILAQSILFLSIFYGIQIIWDRDMGIVHKFLASPTPRAALVLGKSLSAGARALPQALIIYVLALLLGVQMNWNPLALLGVLVMVMLAAACFSTFSLVIACLLKTRDRVMGIGQVLTMPLFFASNAIYPIAIMPVWLQVVARLNPLSYQVDALRALMVTGETSVNGLGVDFAVTLLVTAALIALAARLYPRIVQ
ncbi:MAG TPA: ABC transporter permease [Ktedonobacterales bacterium]|nr:ABC transporter permease [Ktedonobacterales bacterium]